MQDMQPAPDDVVQLATPLRQANRRGTKRQKQVRCFDGCSSVCRALQTSGAQAAYACCLRCRMSNSPAEAQRSVQRMVGPGSAASFDASVPHMNLTLVSSLSR